jgi:hypothetical protein
MYVHMYRTLFANMQPGPINAEALWLVYVHTYIWNSGIMSPARMLPAQMSPARMLLL